MEWLIAAGVIVIASTGLLIGGLYIIVRLFGVEDINGIDFSDED
jgi:hypothetical protein